jgi:hypothetical protein
MGVQPWGRGKAKGWILVKGMGSLSAVGWELLGWDLSVFLLRLMVEREWMEVKCYWI